MTSITLELPDKLAAQVQAHQSEAARIVEIGLAGLKKAKRKTVKRMGTRMQQRQQIIEAWESTGLLLKLNPQPEDDAVLRAFTPIHAAGQPASEIIIEQRGPRV